MLEAETLIIGAGVIGSSVAMHLAALGAESIRVIDLDLEGTLSSSELNAGGVRATFNQPLNILASQTTIDYLAAHANEVGYRPCGYLWLQTPERMPLARQARARQREIGWEVEEWDLGELQRRIPFIDKTEDLAGAMFAPRDGLVNPNLVKNHFRREARALGVVFDDRTWLRSVERLGDQGFRVICDRLPMQISEDDKRAILTLDQSGDRPGDRPGDRATPVKYRVSRVINCAGPWAAKVAKLCGYHSPAIAVRRQVCIFDCRDVDLSPYGMIVDTSGVYFHPEATNGLAGLAIKSEPEGFNYSYDGEEFFNELLWPALYERSTRFERLKHLTGWAGLYDVSPDESAIIGQAVSEGRGVPGIFEAHSFSGHGVMHSHAAGLALAELITLGRYRSLDFAPFSADRFRTGQLLHETQVI